MRPCSLLVPVLALALSGCSLGYYAQSVGGQRDLMSRRVPIEEYLADPELPEELRQRLLYVQALDSARCFEEGVLTNPEDGDIGSIFGWGFPAWTGGTLSLIDTVGIQAFVAECDRMAQAYGERFNVSDWLRERAAQKQSFY